MTSISRRSLTRGAAWAAPVAIVGIAAPAYAASNCVPGAVALIAGQSPTSLWYNPSTTTATVTWSATNANGTPRADSTPGETGQVVSTDFDENVADWNFLKMHLPANLAAGQTVTMTLTLSRPSTNVSMTITDIDRDSGSWTDLVIVNTSGYTFTTEANTRVTGLGTAASPFATTFDGGQDSIRSNVRLNWAGPITSVSVTYKAGISGSSDIGQHVGIGLFTVGGC